MIELVCKRCVPRPARLAFAAALIAAAVAVLAAGGCVHNGRPFVTRARLDKGLVVILPGIEGPSVYNAAIRKGLMDADLPYAMEICNWAGLRSGASYAFDPKACRQRADELADRVIEYRRRNPGRPVFLVGHSGGGAIAVFAAEAVAKKRGVGSPPGLAGLVTLAPALGPKYDLTPALAACGGHMVNCFTETDVLLRTGTTVGRNFDGAIGLTAGQQGFTLPPGAPERRRAAFDRLRQIQWERSMLKYGNVGGHLGWTNSRWVAQGLAPILKQWAEQPGEKPWP